ncbi:hypothetical protein GH714_034515 [Hevea brasiliensis]|uniref:Uncharacterized protein n=1 Tax=Hevea brasiliensis TaxID=3981 RepID=A0A6A6NKL8_HEVBR|nr:hypothetical protein GH714_034515 [Hevea brasiliensis]
METKSKSPNAKENPPPVVEKDESSAKDNNASATTVNSNVGSQVPVAEAVKKDAGKEWNSPASATYLHPLPCTRQPRSTKGDQFPVFRSLQESRQISKLTLSSKFG